MVSRRFVAMIELALASKLVAAGLARSLGASTRGCSTPPGAPRASPALLV